MFWAIMILIFYYVLNIVDYLQTIFMISHFGLACELNPIARILFEHNCAWAVKLVLPLILAIEIGCLIKKDPAVIWAVYIVTLLYLLVVLHNFCMIDIAGLWPKMESYIFKFLSLLK